MIGTMRCKTAQHVVIIAAPARLGIRWRRSIPEEHPMAAYLIADIQVTDPATYDQYRPLAAASVARFGGRFVVRGGKIDLLEGGPEPERIVVIEFADADAARRWYRSEEYQRALKIRQSASRGRVFLVEGA
jgi:uncharacterized protein (DUF1330 family)